MGLERAGFRVVSHSEIEPHACAVLARHWPDVPNLGDISEIGGERAPGRGWLADARAGEGHHRGDWTHADVWAGGPPCQGFSVAGQRRGLRDHRSSLATTWLDLVGRYRPGALLLENVPGILSSARGVDWYALLRELGDRGYWWAYRVLDAQWFGVPQRRRRVFLVALDARRHPDPDGPGQVLAVSARCLRDHAAEREVWASAAGRTGRGAGVVGAIPAGQHGFPDGVQEFQQGLFLEQRVDRAPHHPGRGGAPDGLAGRPHDRAWVKGKRAQSVEDDESWREGTVSPTLNGFDTGDSRAVTLVAGASVDDDPLLPLGQDSARYKVIGNGVVTPVAEWIGRRLYTYLEESEC